MKTLIIVESPTKAKHIREMLGKEYLVLATFGHIKELPKKELGVDTATFEPTYVTVKGKQKTISMIKDAAASCDRILLASDPDREGEAISWHVYESLPKNMKEKTQRIEFREITLTGIKKGLSSPRSININVVQSQQARRILDRFAGFKLSPLLWKHIRGRTGLSAGRVQSAALKVLYDRHQEIAHFIPEEYFVIKGLLTIDGYELSSKLVKINDQEAIINDQDYAEEVVNNIKGSQFVISLKSSSHVRRNAPPPFITATLLEDASKKLGFSSGQTMKVAQELFDGIYIGGKTEGLITYMRTDSTRISSEAKEAAREHIQKNYGQRYLGPVELKKGTKSKDGSQDAHEAIRPTRLINPDEIKSYLSPEQFKLYQLIFNRFMASQMTASMHLETEVFIEGHKESSTSLFRMFESKEVFEGYKVIYKDLEDSEEQKEESILTKLDTQSSVKEKEIRLEKHVTKPPQAFTEDRLISTLKKLGIGRPSTYETIIRTLITREYVMVSKKKMDITELGILVIETLLRFFPEILESGFTSDMEESLDHIAEGNQRWKELVKDFYFELERLG